MGQFGVIVLLSLVISVATAQRSQGNCQFTQDCSAYPLCQNIQDASCVCNFGKCIISGNPFFRGNQCNKYTDCACRNNPSQCFCKGGFCTEQKWECHKASDCNLLNKCKGKNCACTGNLCEFECSNDFDCKDKHCNRALGYQCKCEKSLCAYKEKPKECKNIGDCVRQGKCKANKPCACTQNFCTLPWWVQQRNQRENCRSDVDCAQTILDCKRGCSCQDMRRINDWERRGTCKPRVKSSPSISFNRGFSRNQFRNNRDRLIFQ